MYTRAFIGLFQCALHFCILYHTDACFFLNLFHDFHRFSPWPISSMNPDVPVCVCAFVCPLCVIFNRVDW